MDVITKIRYEHKGKCKRIHVQTRSSHVHITHTRMHETTKKRTHIVLMSTFVREIS